MDAPPMDQSQENHPEPLFMGVPKPRISLMFGVWMGSHNVRTRRLVFAYRPPSSIDLITDL